MKRGLLLFAAVLAISFCSAGQSTQGKVKGLVSYSNETVGEKPDAGATVYFIRDTMVSREQSDTINKMIINAPYIATVAKYEYYIRLLNNGVIRQQRFINEEQDKDSKKLEQELLDTFNSDMRKDSGLLVAAQKVIIERSGVDCATFLNVFDKNASLIWANIKAKSETNRLACDRRGHFKASLPVGKYLVFIQSYHSTDSDCELMTYGRLYVGSVEITADKDSYVKTKF